MSIRGVVGLRRRRGVDTKPFGEPGRDQGGLQPVLERESHAEIGRQAQRRDHLRGAYALLTSGCIVRHAPTLTQLPAPRAVMRECRSRGDAGVSREARLAIAKDDYGRADNRSPDASFRSNGAL